MTTTARRIGVLVGLAAEARIALGPDWSIAIGGGTSVGAENAAQRLVNEGADALVSFGLAGGLDLALRPGAVIVPSAVIARDERYATDPDLSRMLGGTTPHVMLGADAIAASAAEKRRLGDATGAAAVDLESGAVARVAAMRGIPFAVLRAICDPVERALPPAALVALDMHGGIRAWRVLASIAARPRQLPALLVLAVDAAAAKRSLRGRVRSLARTPAWPFALPASPR
jgi:adenosylhomocysteine nucleosidase